MSHSAEIRAEMEMAKTARIRGNEGRARVCARRAAGMAARDFLSRYLVKPDNSSQGRIRTNSAYEALQTLATIPGLAPDIRKAVGYLTMGVNQDFKLPPGIDLIDEAGKIIGGLK
jgi:hypothetical protein